MVPAMLRAASASLPLVALLSPATPFALAAITAFGSYQAFSLLRTVMTFNHLLNLPRPLAMVFGPFCLLLLTFLWLVAAISLVLREVADRCAQAEGVLPARLAQRRQEIYLELVASVRANAQRAPLALAEILAGGASLSIAAAQSSVSHWRAAAQRPDTLREMQVVRAAVADSRASSAGQMRVARSETSVADVVSKVVRARTDALDSVSATPASADVAPQAVAEEAHSGPLPWPPTPTALLPYCPAAQRVRGLVAHAAAVGPEGLRIAVPAVDGPTDHYREAFRADAAAAAAAQAALRGATQRPPAAASEVLRQRRLRGARRLAWMTTVSTLGAFGTYLLAYRAGMVMSYITHRARDGAALCGRLAKRFPAARVEEDAVRMLRGLSITPPLPAADKAAVTAAIAAAEGAAIAAAQAAADAKAMAKAARTGRDADAGAAPRVKASDVTPPDVFVGQAGDPTPATTLICHLAGVPTVLYANPEVPAAEGEGRIGVVGAATSSAPAVVVPSDATVDPDGDVVAHVPPGAAVAAGVPVVQPTAVWRLAANPEHGAQADAARALLASEMDRFQSLSGEDLASLCARPVAHVDVAVDPLGQMVYVLDGTLIHAVRVGRSDGADASPDGASADPSVSADAAAPPAADAGADVAGGAPTLVALPVGATMVAAADDAHGRLVAHIDAQKDTMAALGQVTAMDRGYIRSTQMEVVGRRAQVLAGAPFRRSLVAPDSANAGALMGALLWRRLTVPPDQSDGVTVTERDTAQTVVPVPGGAQRIVVSNGRLVAVGPCVAEAFQPVELHDKVSLQPLPLSTLEQAPYHLWRERLAVGHPYALRHLSRPATAFGVVASVVQHIPSTAPAVGALRHVAACPATGLLMLAGGLAADAIYTISPSGRRRAFRLPESAAAWRARRARAATAPRPSPQKPREGKLDQFLPVILPRANKRDLTGALLGEVKEGLHVPSTLPPVPMDFYDPKDDGADVTEAVICGVGVTTIVPLRSAEAVARALAASDADRAAVSEASVVSATLEVGCPVAHAVAVTCECPTGAALAATMAAAPQEVDAIVAASPHAATGTTAIWRAGIVPTMAAEEQEYDMEPFEVAASWPETGAHRVVVVACGGSVALVGSSDATVRFVHVPSGAMATIHAPLEAIRCAVPDAAAALDTGLSLVPVDASVNAAGTAGCVTFAVSPAGGITPLTDIAGSASAYAHVSFVVYYDVVVAASVAGAAAETGASNVVVVGVVGGVLVAPPSSDGSTPPGVRAARVADDGTVVATVYRSADVDGEALRMEQAAARPIESVTPWPATSLVHVDGAAVGDRDASGGADANVDRHDDSNVDPDGASPSLSTRSFTADGSSLGVGVGQPGLERMYGSRDVAAAAARVPDTQHRVVRPVVAAWGAGGADHDAVRGVPADHRAALAAWRGHLAPRERATARLAIAHSLSAAAPVAVTAGLASAV